eukprot:1136490-Pelagomonas_calceolata.AAC.5
MHPPAPGAQRLQADSPLHTVHIPGSSTQAQHWGDWAASAPGKVPAHHTGLKPLRVGGSSGAQKHRRWPRSCAVGIRV